MSVAMARIVVDALGLYLGLGLAFAVAFHLRGIPRVDAQAARGSLGFRVLVTPGVVALWPLLARRWRSARGVPPEPHDAHRDAAGEARA
jgi:hypothetical protein